VAGLASPLNAHSLLRRAVPLVSVTIACVLVLAPLVVVFLLSLSGPSLDIYKNLLLSHRILTVLGRTILIALSTVILAIPTGLTIGFSSPRARGVLIWIFSIAGFSPFLVRGYSFVGILGHDGPIERLRVFLHLPGSSLLGTQAGVTFTLTHALLPPVIVFIALASDRQLRQLLTTATTLGAYPLERFLLVTLPRLMPSIAGGFAFAFLTSAGAFVVPALVGGGRETLMIQVIFMYAVELSDFRTAAALSMIFVVTTLTVAATLRYYTARIGAGGFSQRALYRIASLLRWLSARRIAALGSASRRVATSFSLMLVTGPLLYVIAVGFQKHNLLALPTDGISLKWYVHVFSDSSWLEATWTTLRIGLVSALLATSAAYVAAYAAHRLGGLQARTLTLVVLMPATVPIIMLGLGLYLIESRLGLIDTEIGVAIAHSFASLPISYLVLSAAEVRYSSILDEVAAVTGANRIFRLLFVRIPLLAPSLLAALLLSFLISLEEVVMTLLIADTNVKTISLRMWSSATHSTGPELAVPSTVLLIGTMLASIVALRQTSGLNAILRPTSPHPQGR
jgi:putative spermidine/putrescine transport system permease protein